MAEMKGLVVILLIVLVGGSTTLVLRLPFSSDPVATLSDQLLFTAKRGKLTVTVTENGSLMAKNSERITAQIKRGGKVTFLIEEGKTVEENEVLCRLDTTALKTQRQQLELDIVKTDADLFTAQTELEIQESETVADVEKAQIAMTKAQMELERYRDGDAPKERRNLEVAIKEAETKHSRAKKKHEDSVMLLEQKYINQSQVDQDQIDFERSEIELNGAQRDLEIFDKYTYPMTMTERQTAISDAQRQLDNAEKRGQATLRQKEVAVESQERRLTRLKEQLDEVKEEIENFTITSPSPGIVIYGDPNQPWYRNEIKLGGQIWGGFTLFTIPDLRVMQVQMQVHEADINKIKEGQVATVTMDTYPGLVLQGKVSKIAAIAGDPNSRATDEVKKFGVDITLDSTGEQTLKPGISAKAEIFVEERDDVLFAPLQCVFLEEGIHYCHVLRNGEPLRMAVKPGLSNDTYIEIVEGVEEGEQVLLYNPTLQPNQPGVMPEAPAPDGDRGPSAPAPVEQTSQAWPTPKSVPLLASLLSMLSQ